MAKRRQTLSIGERFEAFSKAITQFTDIPGVMAQAPAQNAPTVATARSGQAVHTFVTSSRSGYQFAAGAHYEGGNN